MRASLLMLAVALTACLRRTSPEEAAAKKAEVEALVRGSSPLLSPPTGAAEGASTLSESPLLSAVEHLDRLAADVARDADRAPLAVMIFAGVEAGMAVADLMAGRGHYTELFARAVGPSGTVCAQNSAYVIERFAGGQLSERLSRLGLPHVVRLDRELDAADAASSSRRSRPLGSGWRPSPTPSATQRTTARPTSSTRRSGEGPIGSRCGSASPSRREGGPPQAHWENVTVPS